MRNEKIWKKVTALMISTALAIPAPAVSAAAPPAGQEDISVEQQEGAELSAVEGSRAADADDDGFTIEDGVLISYTGTATEVVIPDGVTEIGDEAFAYCDSLTSVTIPDSVISIGGSAFSDCSSLTSITIPEGVISIGKWAFSNCSSLTSVTIPKSVTSIVDRTFSGCRSLTSVVISSGVTSIGKLAFRNCSSLTSVTIPSSVTSIGDLAFYSCSSLTSVTIPFSVKSIGRTAFGYIENEDEDIEIPGFTIYGFKNSAAENYADRHDFTFKVISGGDEQNNGFMIEDGVLTKYNGSETEVIIPDEVKAIGPGAFSYCSSLESITISSNVTSIGDWAFKECHNLESVTIPSSVTSLGDEIFSGCYYLGSVIIPSSVTSIGKHAFSYCSSLTSITIPSSVTNIGDYAFGYDEDEDEDYVQIPGFTIYGTEGSAAESYAKENGFTFKVGSGDDEQYDGFTIEDGVLVKYTGDAAHVMIPDGVKEIKEDAFLDVRYGTGPEKITIPASVEKISAAEASMGLEFANIDSLEEIIVAEGNNNYASEDGCLYNKDKTVLLVCPRRKTELNIPAGVKEIGEYACGSYGNAVERVVVPDGATKIGNWAFSGCSRLGGIAIPASVTEMGYGIFGSIGRLLTIYGEAGSYAETYARENNIPFSTEEMPGHGTSGKLSDCQITLWQDSCIYNGGEQTPGVIVKNGTYILSQQTDYISDADYTVTYQNNVNVGTAKIILTGTGNYTGTVIRTFTIKKGEPGKLSYGKNDKNFYKIFVWDVVYDSDGYVKSKSMRCASLAVDGSHYRFTAQQLSEGEKLLSPKIQEGQVNGADVVLTFEYEREWGFPTFHGTGSVATGSICYDLYARTEDGKPVDGISLYKEGYLNGYGEDKVFFTDECQFTSDGKHELFFGGCEEGTYFSWIRSGSTVDGYTKLAYWKEDEDGTIIQYVPRDYQIGDRVAIDDTGEDGKDEYGNTLRRIYESREAYLDEVEEQEDYRVSVLDASGEKIGDVVVIPPKDDELWRASPEIGLTYRVENLAEGWKIAAQFSKTKEFFEHPETGKKVDSDGWALASITATRLSGNTIDKQSQSLSCTKTYNKKYGDKPFKLNAKLKKGNGKLTFASSDKKVAVVDKNSGKVTIKGTGAATITVSAGENANYKKATAKILIKVSPAKQKTPSVKVQKGKKLKISWKKDKKATGYEIQYSTDRKFKNKKSTKTVTIKKNKTVTTIIKKNLKKGKRYYVRVRSYKSAKVNGKTQKLYGAWSSVKKSGKIK